MSVPRLIHFEWNFMGFKALFGSQERKELTLQLYNAMNGSSYANPEDIELTTIDDVVYMGMRNDVSFLLNHVMNLWEQQSTPNGNMPLRFLMYYAHVMERYVSMLSPERGGIYRETAIQVPTPRMVLFYNGPGRMPEYLRLSDAYMDATDPDLELRVRVININSGQDRILEQCRPLQDYTEFVESFHRYRMEEGISNRAAASRAIAELPDGAVKDYLRGHEAEVVDMLLTEYNEEKALKAEYYAGKREGRQEGLQEGLEQGRQEGRMQELRTICELVADGHLAIDVAVSKSAKCGITSEADLRRSAAGFGIQLPE